MEVVETSEESFREAAERIKKERLVAFPTETVYGLGANALSLPAVLKIFEAKKRPLTDPLIVHVSSWEMALSITAVDVNSNTFKLCKNLTDRYWPGPLTVILRASEKIPLEVTARTGLVGVRMPNHKVALKLIEVSNLPIAAPSANTFGHVSPTLWKHVYDDLHHYDILLLKDPAEEKARNKSDEGNYKVGIESTVVKIIESKEKITLQILREGGISKLSLNKTCLELENELGINLEVVVFKKQATPADPMLEAECSPGQEITHYAPSLDTFILARQLDFKLLNKYSTILLKPAENMEEIFVAPIELEKTVFIDFGCANVEAKEIFLKYFDLSQNNDMEEAAKNLYSILRQSENVEEARYCLIHNFSLFPSEFTSAVYDRIFRSASGKLVVHK